jgi:hypothetical protein
MPDRKNQKTKLHTILHMSAHTKHAHLLGFRVILMHNKIIEVKRHKTIYLPHILFTGGLIP